MTAKSYLASRNFHISQLLAHPRTQLHKHNNDFSLKSINYCFILDVERMEIDFSFANEIPSSRLIALYVNEVASRGLAV